MMISNATIFVTALLSNIASGFVPSAMKNCVRHSLPRHFGGVPRQHGITTLRDTSAAVEEKKTAEESFDQEKYIAESKAMRMKYLEEQAMFSLKVAVEEHEDVVFPNALIAGDSVITHLLNRMGYLESGTVKVMVVDTFHLFPETLEFLKEMENKYGFKSSVFAAQNVPLGDKAAFDAKYGANLWKEDIEQYDKVCKVEPFQRGLKELDTNCMITGRMRWQGVERAWIDQFENAPVNGGLAKINPLAYWTLEDVFEYIATNKIPHHPLHGKGYPSIGDAKDTVPVPEDGSVRFQNFQFIGDKTQWLDYASERKGRFVGLSNKDGSKKTECGIHVDGSERTWDRDLWEEGKSAVKKLHTPEEARTVVSSGKPSVLTVYAPWCPWSQKMEEEYENFAESVEGKMDVYSFRGDEERPFAMAELNTSSFPTVNVVTADGHVIKYESEERTVADFQSFVAKSLA